MNQLLVFKVVIEGHDRDPVVQLQAERADRIVDEKHVSEGVRLDEAEVLDVNAVLSADAVLSVQSELDEGPVGVHHLVYHRISVVLARGCEDAHVIA